MAFKAKKYEFVEVVVPGAPDGQTLTRYNFPDLPKLRDTKLQAITCYPNEIVELTPNNNQVASSSMLRKSFLVLYSNERQDLYRIPLSIMNNVSRNDQDDDDYTASTMFLYEFNDQNVTWDKCYIEIANSPGNTDNFSFGFGLYYI
jgi:hypothetical protein